MYSIKKQNAQQQQLTITESIWENVTLSQNNTREYISYICRQLSNRVTGKQYCCYTILMVGAALPPCRWKVRSYSNIFPKETETVYVYLFSLLCTTAAATKRRGEYFGISASFDWGIISFLEQAGERFWAFYSLFLLMSQKLGILPTVQ